MRPWVTFAVIALLVSRGLYAIQIARDNRGVFSKWTDPWF